MVTDGGFSDGWRVMRDRELRIRGCQGRLELTYSILPMLKYSYVHVYFFCSIYNTNTVPVQKVENNTTICKVFLFHYLRQQLYLCTPLAEAKILFFIGIRSVNSPEFWSQGKEVK